MTLQPHAAISACVFATLVIEYHGSACLTHPCLASWQQATDGMMKLRNARGRSTTHRLHQPGMLLASNTTPPPATGCLSVAGAG
jgi:hypothetical protein